MCRTSFPYLLVLSPIQCLFQVNQIILSCMLWFSWYLCLIPPSIYYRSQPVHASVCLWFVSLSSFHSSVCMYVCLSFFLTDRLFFLSFRPLMQSIIEGYTMSSSDEVTGISHFSSSSTTPSTPSKRPSTIRPLTAAYQASSSQNQVSPIPLILLQICIYIPASLIPRPIY